MDTCDGQSVSVRADGHRNGVLEGAFVLALGDQQEGEYGIAAGTKQPVRRMQTVGSARRRAAILRRLRMPQVKVVGVDYEEFQTGAQLPDGHASRFPQAGAYTRLQGMRTKNDGSGSDYRSADIRL